MTRPNLLFSGGLFRISSDCIIYAHTQLVYIPSCLTVPYPIHSVCAISSLSSTGLFHIPSVYRLLPYSIGLYPILFICIIPHPICLCHISPSSTGLFPIPSYCTIHPHHPLSYFPSHLTVLYILIIHWVISHPIWLYHIYPTCNGLFHIQSDYTIHLPLGYVPSQLTIPNLLFLHWVMCHPSACSRSPHLDSILSYLSVPYLYVLHFVIFHPI